MSTIPASAKVNVIPGVLGSGGNGLQILELVLTQNTRVPIGQVQSFISLAAVAAFFGASSNEAILAGIYFNGFIGASISPGSILFSQYATSPVPAYLRGGSVAALTLAQLQAVSGSLSINVDGYQRSAVINLSAAVSFSSAAQSIQTSLNASPANVAVFTASIAGTTLTVTGTSSGSISAGQTLSGSGVAANTLINSQLSGTIGGIGTYQLSGGSQTVGSEAMTSTPTNISVTFDAISGGFLFTSGVSGTASTIAFAVTGTVSNTLNLTQALGAVISQGSAANTPTPFMNNIVNNITQNWATFQLVFDPDNGLGNAQKLLFAQWANSTNGRYAFICWDTDINPTLSTNAPTSLGKLLAAGNISGTCLIYAPTNLQNIAAFVGGAAASINFNQTNGRITFDFKGQTGLPIDVSNQQVAANLLANGYNYLGAFATANQNFQFFDNGQVSGPFLFLDSYINQIWLNAQIQLALMTFLTSVNAVPYNPAGYAAIENAMATVIQQGLNFGAFSAGVVLSSSQVIAVNNQAGRNIAGTLQQQGWYLQVLDPGPNVRAQRGSPIVNFWYTDGEAVQLISMNSVQVQ